MKIKRCYSDLQKQLESLEQEDSQVYAKKLQKTLRNNQDLINEIVDNCGPGSIFLSSAYDLLYKQGDYEKSGIYQDELETINSLALLGEEA